MNGSPARLRVLVVAEGAPNFWRQIALSFHAAGCHVSYVTLRPGIVADLMATGIAYDLVVTNQLGIHEFAIPVRDTPALAWERHFKRFLMVQFHDATRELPTLAQAGRILGWKSMRLAYLVYCRSTFDLLTQTKAYWDCHFTHLPIAFDNTLAFADDAPTGYVDDIAGAIAPRNPDQTGQRELAFFPKLIYIGSYFFDGTLCLRPDGPFTTIPAFRQAIARYLEQGHAMDRLGFIKDLLARGEIAMDHLLNGHAGEYLYNYACTVILANRRQHVEAAKKAYGPDFHLYGAEWQAFGLDSIPGERAASDDKYRSAFISVDFGSTFVDNSLYQRIQQILACNGRIMQLRQPDAADVYGPFAEHVCFDSADGLRAKVDAALAAPAAYLARQAEFVRFMRERHDPAAIGGGIMRSLELPG